MKKNKMQQLMVGALLALFTVILTGCASGAYDPSGGDSTKKLVELDDTALENRLSQVEMGRIKLERIYQAGLPIRTKVDGRLVQMHWNKILETVSVHEVSEGNGSSAILSDGLILKADARGKIVYNVAYNAAGKEIGYQPVILKTNGTAEQSDLRFYTQVAVGVIGSAVNGTVAAKIHVDGAKCGKNCPGGTTFNIAGGTALSQSAAESNSNVKVGSCPVAGGCPP